jgi:hypothetical protein
MIMVRKILYFLTMAAVLGLIIISCEDENEGQKQVQMVDVSSRITGVPAFAGAGAKIEVEGTGLTEVERIIFDVYVIRKIEIDTTDTGISFSVPAQVGEGENEVAFLFPNNEIAYTTIMILPLQIISGFDPTNGNLGDTVELYGNNLHIVTEVAVGGTVAEIVDLDTTLIRFLVPAGAVTDVITATSGAGTAESKNEFIACETAVDNVRCFQNYCLYGDMENLGVPYGPWDGGGGPIIPSSDASDNPTQDAIFLQGGDGVLSQWEVIHPIGGTSDLGKTSLKCTVLQIGTEPYQIQLVYNAFKVPAGKIWLYSGKIWADADGRQVLTQPETDPPGGYNPTLLPDGSAIPIQVLHQGWNEFSVELIHDMSVSLPPGNPKDEELRPGIKLSYAENAGGVFIFDDIRVVEIGNRP